MRTKSGKSWKFIFRPIPGRNSLTESARTACENSIPTIARNEQSEKGTALAPAEQHPLNVQLRNGHPLAPPWLLAHFGLLNLARSIVLLHSGRPVGARGSYPTNLFRPYLVRHNIPLWVPSRGRTGFWIPPPFDRVSKGIAFPQKPFPVAVVARRRSLRRGGGIVEQGQAPKVPS